MPHYRFFFVKDDGMPARGTAFPSPTDERAIAFAILAAGGEAAELWSGDRKVWSRQRNRPARPEF